MTIDHSVVFLHSMLYHTSVTWPSILLLFSYFLRYIIVQSHDHLSFCCIHTFYTISYFNHVTIYPSIVSIPSTLYHSSVTWPSILLLYSYTVHYMTVQSHDHLSFCCILTLYMTSQFSQMTIYCSVFLYCTLYHSSVTWPSIMFHFYIEWYHSSATWSNLILLYSYTVYHIILQSNDHLSCCILILYTMS